MVYAERSRLCLTSEVLNVRARDDGAKVDLRALGEGKGLNREGRHCVVESRL